jgi:hypothetical protein
MLREAVQSTLPPIDRAIQLQQHRQRQADVSSPRTAYPVFCALIDDDAAYRMALIVHRVYAGHGLDGADRRALLG